MPLWNCGEKEKNNEIIVRTKEKTNHYDDKAATDTVKNDAREVCNAGVNLKKVILYGSYAKGRQYFSLDINALWAK